MVSEAANGNTVCRLYFATAVFALFLTDAVFLADITHLMKFISLNVIFLSFPIVSMSVSVSNFS